ncbi:MAG: hypothetical protein U1E27_13975 [Kiritimatiellia bacterium]|nr:hypothetical protein [Kiritimatiellia bacterium]
MAWCLNPEANVSRQTRPVRLGFSLLFFFVLLAGSGCRTAALDSARSNFYQGRVREAAEELSAIEPAERDRVLFLMERGTIRQALGEREDSTRDFVEAADLLGDLETYSLSGGATSLVINDSVQPFRGAPYERTLLHGMTALNHLADGRWDLAAVEARRILRTLDPDHLGNYPEDAFSRYVAGFAFEMTDDPSNAALQYRLADERATEPPLGERERPTRNSPDPDASSEWVIFLLSGEGPDAGNVRFSSGFGEALRVDVVQGDRILGQGRKLADTRDLARETDRVDALWKTAKTATRFVIKEILAEAAAQSAESDAVGDLVRLVLFGLFEEQAPRRWITLPGSFWVARVPCSPEEGNLTLVIHGSAGRAPRVLPVPATSARRRSTRVSVIRDLPN